MDELQFDPDWSKLRSMLSDSSFVPTAILGMCNAPTEAEATTAYWKLDNHVVVQGQLFQASEYVAAELVVRICTGQVTSFGMGFVIDLLVEIVYGESDESEIALGNDALGDRCRANVLSHVDCFYKLSAGHASDRVRAGALDILDFVETDRGRLINHVASLMTAPTSSAVGARLAEIAFPEA
jgi:hypothetical protein